MMRKLKLLKLAVEDPYFYKLLHSIGGQAQAFLFKILDENEKMSHNEFSKNACRMMESLHPWNSFDIKINSKISELLLASSKEIKSLKSKEPTGC